MEFSIHVDYATQIEATDERKRSLFGSMVKLIGLSWDCAGSWTIFALNSCTLNL